ncbi:hypothetical protein OS175_13315 [Marinicella sp. S1101]|uniref:hypothetical protein n=1 Tax=Marinicella marina TaxID=2996016 RepID=UPI002260CB4D|nr:hypothetical protein [Marinicella marina]MCX7554853.1 hypothetical protein [Marinicella marina]MDJ1141511.1 hypothetical protein [Marinicella marina]
MEELGVIFYLILVFLLFFGVPIKHLIALFGSEEKLAQLYENPEDYRDLALIQVANMVFLFLVYLGAWLMLRNAGPGSFNGIMLLPFIVIYFTVMVIHQKKINRLARNNEARWE